MTPPESLAYARARLGAGWVVRWHGCEAEFSARRGDVAVYARDVGALIERAWGLA